MPHSLPWSFSPSSCPIAYQLKLWSLLQGNKLFDTLILDVRASSDFFFINPGQSFLFHRFYRSYPLRSLKTLLSKTFQLSASSFDNFVTLLSPEGPVFLGIVWLFQRWSLAGYEQCERDQKAKLPKAKLTEIKAEQTQVSLLGKTINCSLFHCNDSAGGARGQFVHRLIVAGTWRVEVRAELARLVLNNVRWIYCVHF